MSNNNVELDTLDSGGRRDVNQPNAEHSPGLLPLATSSPGQDQRGQQSGSATGSTSTLQVISSKIEAIGVWVVEKGSHGIRSIQIVSSADRNNNEPPSPTFLTRTGSWFTEAGSWSLNKLRKSGSWIKRTFKSIKRPGNAAITGILIALFGAIIALVALIPAYQSLRISQWTALKDFLLVCSDNSTAISADKRSTCAVALREGLPPPPYMSIKDQGSSGYRTRSLLSRPHDKRDGSCLNSSEDLPPGAFFRALPVLSTGSLVGIGILLTYVYIIWMLQAIAALEKFITENYWMGSFPGPLARSIEQHLFGQARDTRDNNDTVSARRVGISLKGTFSLLLPTSVFRWRANSMTIAFYWLHFVVLAGLATAMPHALYWLYARRGDFETTLMANDMLALCKNGSYKFLPSETCVGGHAYQTYPPGRHKMGTIDDVFITLSLAISFCWIPARVSYVTGERLVIDAIIMIEHGFDGRVRYEIEDVLEAPESSESLNSPSGPGPVPPRGHVPPQGHDNPDSQSSHISLSLPVGGHDSSHSEVSPILSPYRATRTGDTDAISLDPRGLSLPADPMPKARGRSSGRDWPGRRMDRSPRTIREALSSLPDDEIAQALKFLKRRKAFRKPSGPIGAPVRPLDRRW